MQGANPKIKQSNKGLRTTLVGILVSFVLAMIKGVSGVIGHSYALIADAIESSADILTSGMLLIGLKWAARPADNDHPYGHGKAEALVSLGIALALCMAALLITVESVQHILTPHKTPAPFTLLVLVAVIITKELLYRFVIKTGTEINSGAVKADAFHHRSDALTSAAAFIGISIGLIGGKGYEVADDWAALLAAAVIIINAYKIARPAIGELLDEELDPQLNKDIKSIAAEVEGVIKVEKCHTRKMGVMAYADLHVWVNSRLTVEEGHSIAHQVKDHIQQTFPQFADVLIHIEPAT